MLIAKKTILATITVPREKINEIVLSLITAGLVQPVFEEVEIGEKTKEIKELLNQVMLAKRKSEVLAKQLGTSSAYILKRDVRFRYRDWLLNAEDALKMFDEVEKIIESELENLSKVKDLYEEYSRLLYALTPFAIYDIDLNLKPQFFEYVAVTLDRGKLDSLLRSIDMDRAVVEIQQTEPEGALGALIVYSADYSEYMKRLISRLGATPISIPETLPQNPYKAYHYLMKTLDSLRRELDKDITYYAQILSRVYTMLFVVESALMILASARLDTGDLVIVKGYVEKDRVNDLDTMLNQLTEGSYTLSVEEVSEGPIVPSAVRVPRLLRPFQKIVLQYGAPLPNEIVPTLFLAITYPLLFGLMFQDAGHALAIMLFGVYFYYKRKSEYGILFIYLGIPAFITGLLAGEFFGPLLGMKYFLWGGHPPLASPLEAKSPEEALVNLISLALRVGAGLIIIGVTLNLLNSYLSRDFTKMILVSLPKLTLFSIPLIGFVVFRVDKALHYIYDAAIGGAITLYGKVILYGFIISVLSLFLLEPIYEIIVHKKVRGLGMYLMKSFMEVFESILAIIGNLASFLRILGLALAHAGIMFGFSAMAEHALHGSPMGIAAGIAAYAFGNIVCIGIEGIVAYAQCMRLHFYEWFSKFYSGRGTIFSPIKIPVAVYFLH